MNSENITTFSAKDLCSRSCKQIKMFNEHPELRPKPNENVINGSKFQDEVALSFDNLIGQEMRGTYIKDDIIINFSNDIVCKDKIVEVKSVNREIEDWYFNCSILQCAVYKSLLTKTNKKLSTSRFYLDMGHPLIETIVDNDIDYYLKFGDKTYKVIVNNPDKIVNFIFAKAKACLQWDTAKRFDESYKFKEFSELNKYFSAIEI